MKRSGLNHTGASHTGSQATDQPRMVLKERVNWLARRPLTWHFVIDRRANGGFLSTVQDFRKGSPCAGGRWVQARTTTRVPTDAHS